MKPPNNQQPNKNSLYDLYKELKSYYKNKAKANELMVLVYYRLTVWDIVITKEELRYILVNKFPEDFI